MNGLAVDPRIQHAAVTSWCSVAHIDSADSKPVAPHLTARHEAARVSRYTGGGDGAAFGHCTGVVVRLIACSRCSAGPGGVGLKLTQYGATILTYSSSYDAIELP